MLPLKLCNSNVICVVGGDSAGHLLPALAIGYTWQQAQEHGKLVLCTGSKQLEQQILTNYSIDEIISFTSDRKSKKYFRTLSVLFWVGCNFLIALKLLRKLKPASVVATGGMLSVPIVIAAWVLRVPVELYELNAVPGKATKFLAPFATRIALVFDECKQYWRKKKSILKKCRTVAYPLRTFSLVDRGASYQDIKTDKKISVLVVGGSQGSVFLNNLWQDFILGHLELASKLSIVHQAGPTLFKVEERYEKASIIATVFDYQDNLDRHYNTADIVIARGGAGTLFELVYFGKKAIIVPLVTTSNNHQVHNAYAMQKRFPTLFTVLEQQDAARLFEDTVLAHLAWNR